MTILHFGPNWANGEAASMLTVALPAGAASVSPFYSILLSAASLVLLRLPFSTFYSLVTFSRE